MKTIGLIGGMSWESTVPYYRLINEAVRDRLGGLHSAKLILLSVDFEEIEVLQRAGDWQRAGEILAEAAKALERAGADFLVLCTNTMHKVAPAIEAATRLPLLHIADATGREVRGQGIRTVGLLGTAFTMEQEFYRGRLESEHGLRVLVPVAAGREIIHRVIYEELCRGRVLDPSRRAYREIIAKLVEGGAEGIILGCTEIGLLIGPGDAPVPLFDTTTLHAAAAVDFALAEQPAA